MRRVLSILSTFFCVLTGAQNVDSTRLAALDSTLLAYTESIRGLDTDAKEAETDFLIGSCTDSMIRQRVALKLYSTYLDSPLMGEEAVAIHIYDKWFAGGEVRMKTDIDLMNARIFADFNRLTLIGCDAPKLVLKRPDGESESIPEPGTTAILYFYDTSCSNCKAQSILLPYALSEVSFPLNFYAIYTGTDLVAWTDFIRDGLVIPSVRVHHLWDPEIDSDYQKLYGILSTPKMYLVEPQGTIIGRRLEVESLTRLLPYAGAIQNLYDKHLK